MKGQDPNVVTWILLWVESAASYFAAIWYETMENEDGSWGSRRLCPLREQGLPKSLLAPGGMAALPESSVRAARLQGSEEWTVSGACAGKRLALSSLLVSVLSEAFVSRGEKGQKTKLFLTWVISLFLKTLAGRKGGHYQECNLGGYGRYDKFS